MKRKTRYEYSAGAVVFKREADDIKFLVIKSCTGVFGYPKGHVERGETEKEAAVREVREETGITARLIDGFERRNEYPIPFLKNTVKRVVYFLGEYESGIPTPQEKETSGVYFLPFEEAERRFYFENLKEILHAARDFIENNCK